MTWIITKYASVRIYWHEDMSNTIPNLPRWHNLGEWITTKYSSVRIEWHEAWNSWLDHSNITTYCASDSSLNVHVNIHSHLQDITTSTTYGLVIKREILMHLHLKIRSHIIISPQWTDMHTGSAMSDALNKRVRMDPEQTDMWIMTATKVKQSPGSKISNIYIPVESL